MLARPLFVITVLVLCGCAAGPDASPDAVAAHEAAAQGSAWSQTYFAEGRAVYGAHCASCHDSGASEAPIVGVRGDWAGRSSLWTAVLSEHAKAGYLQMPARGATPELTDKDVNAAAEYMLTVTFPELPVD